VVVVNLDSHMDAVEVLGSVVCLRSCCDCLPCSSLLLSEKCICRFGGLLARKNLSFVFGSFTTKSHLVGFFYISPFDDDDVLTLGICDVHVHSWLLAVGCAYSEAKSSYFYWFLAAS